MTQPNRVLDVPRWVRGAFGFNPWRDLGRYRVMIPVRDGQLGEPRVWWTWAGWVP